MATISDILLRRNGSAGGGAGDSESNGPGSDSSKDDQANTPRRGDVKKFKALVQKLHQQRLRLENEWRLELAFFQGDHYASINRHNRRFEPGPTHAGERPKHQVRSKINYIQVYVGILLSRMTKNQPEWSALPATSDQSDVKAARLSEALMESLWQKLNCAGKLDEAILWSLITSSGWWEVFWDAAAGKRITFVKDPESGQPIVDDAHAEAMRQIAQANGTELETIVVNEGEVGIESLSPFEVYLVGGRSPEEASAAIKVKGYDPETIEERWGARVEPDSQSESFSFPYGQDKRKDLALIHQIYVKPSNQVPEGYYAVWHQDKMLAEYDYPYEHGELPFTRFDGVKNPGAQYDISLVWQLMGPMQQYNRVLSMIQEHIHLTLRPQMLANVGSIRTPMTNEPGLVVEFAGPNQPQWRQIPSLPSYVFEYLKILLQGMQDIAGLHDTVQGKVPPNIEAGIAINLLQEQDDTRIGPRSRQLERALSRAGGQMLSLCKQFYLEERLCRVSGASGMPEVKAFKGADLEGSQSIQVVEDSMLPQSKAAQDEMLLKLMDKGMLDPKKGIPALSVGNKEMVAFWDADRAKQQREIDKSLRGDPMGDPQFWDDHEIHMDVCKLAMNSAEFESYPPEAQVAIGNHYMGHFEIQRMFKPLDPNVKVNMRLEGDAGPTAISQALAGFGTPIPPQVLQQESRQMDMDKAQSQMLIAQNEAGAEAAAAHHVHGLQQGEPQDGQQ